MNNFIHSSLEARLSLRRLKINNDQPIFLYRTRAMPLAFRRIKDDLSEAPVLMPGRTTTAIHISGT